MKYIIDDLIDKPIELTVDIDFHEIVSEVKLVSYDREKFNLLEKRVIDNYISDNWESLTGAMLEQYETICEEKCISSYIDEA